MVPATQNFTFNTLNSLDEKKASVADCSFPVFPSFSDYFCNY